LICTNFAFIFSLKSLKRLNVFETNLIIGLEPVYGIILAYFFLNEGQYLELKFYIASLLIFTLIFLHPYLKKKVLN
jgi:drug/metabolite transporter (DMT)-like permease